MASLHRARVEIDAHIRNREPVLAVGRKVVSELHPAARAERKTVDVEWLIAFDRLGIVGAGELGLGFADRQSRRETRGGDILIEKRRRDAQRRGDVVEPVNFDLGRQQRLGIDLDAQQIVDRGSELRPRQPLNRNMSGALRNVGAAFSAARYRASLHPRDERVDLFLIRLAASRRRHLPSAQFAEGFLPDVGVFVNGVQRKRIERDASGLGLRVVAPDAVGVEVLRAWSELPAAVGADWLCSRTCAEGRRSQGGSGDADTEGSLHRPE